MSKPNRAANLPTFSVEHRRGITADPSPGLSVKGGMGEWYYFAETGGTYQWVGDGWQWQGTASRSIPKLRRDIREFLKARVMPARFVFISAAQA